MLADYPTFILSIHDTDRKQGRLIFFLNSVEKLNILKFDMIRKIAWND